MTSNNRFFEDRKAPANTTRFASEEAYFLADGKQNGYYYTFDAPANWLQTNSINKSIAFRRCKFEDMTERVISCDITIYNPLQGFDQLLRVGIITMDVTIATDSTPSSIMDAILEKANKYITEDWGETEEYKTIHWDMGGDIDEPSSIPEFIASYDRSNGVTNITIGLYTPVGNDIGEPIRKISIQPRMYNNSHNGWLNFLMVFNMSDPNHLTTPQDTIKMLDVYECVYPRYVHADFVSPTQHSYLCAINDFYPEPTKIYRYTNATSKIRIWFSKDGRTHTYVPPSNTVVLELCFIAVTADNYAT